MPKSPPSTSRKRKKLPSPPTSDDSRQKKRRKSGKIKILRITDDVDFARNDYDGRIKRREERINAGYATKRYKAKLEKLKKEKKLQAQIMKKHPGKSWEVCQRLADLQGIATYLKSIKDPHRELPNVKAIMAAYEKGKLKWDDNATYWCQGKMIAGPSVFDWQDFGRLNTKENRGDGGFCVEGSNNDVQVPELNMILRLDKSIHGLDPDLTKDSNGEPFPEVEMKFTDDTGATMMTIFHDDMLDLMGGDAEGATAPVDYLMGYESFSNADGTTRHAMIIAVEVNMNGTDKDGNKLLMSDTWSSIPCSVFEDGEAVECRLHSIVLNLL
ncbi:hypothetical protein N7456_004998 [Penicillium angulare]|uniref:Uncharacterized protein n=1 Tax=Penicillium angulare TaxID=116970 RepID=A0A9W9FXM0_9EURO|nr:hypothetical protein N7456_004998 [Penicillium angulare]